MGRLSKSKIDRIQKLIKKGYLQKEVAKMADVNVKTVRTYDPLRKTSTSRVQPVQNLKGHVPPPSFYRDIRFLADWIATLYLCVLDADKVPCPHCLFPSQQEKRKSKVVVLKVLDNGDYKCPECGEILASPPNLAWRLFVTEAAEELRREEHLPAKGEAES